MSGRLSSSHSKSRGIRCFTELTFQVATRTFAMMAHGGSEGWALGQSSSCDQGSNSASMTYVAFLRGVNVGGKGIVSMAAINNALVTLGLSDVQTYINSGNVIFSTRATGAVQLATRIEKALEQHTGMAIKVLVMDHKTLKKIVEAIPRKWVDDQTMRTYVLLLWKELDNRGILDRLPIKPGVDELMYTPGAVVWRVDRENVGRSPR